MPKTVEERALALMNEVLAGRGMDNGLTRLDRTTFPAHEALCRALKAHDADIRAVSDAVETYNANWRNGTPSRDAFMATFSRFILPKPIDQITVLSREMVLMDGVVRTKNQADAIRDGRAARDTAVEFDERLRKALASRGLKLVEVGDAD